MNIIFQVLHVIFYKQQFYKQRQAAFWGRTFTIWRLLAFFIHIITPT